MEQWQQGPSFEGALAVESAIEPPFHAAQFNAALHYHLAECWWQQHGWPAVPPETLPACGITVFNYATPVCVSFMYIDSGWGCIAWTVADATLPKEIRRAAVDFAIETLTALGDELGLTWLYTCTRNPAMVDRYTRLGWIAAETDFQQFIRVRPSAYGRGESEEG